MVLPVAGAVIACAAGFAASLIMNTDLIKSDNEEFAIKAANAFNSSLPINSELCVYRAYVRKSTSLDECILYTMNEYGGQLQTKICRVVVEHDKPDILNLYYVIDPESDSYLAMKNSADPKLRIEASLLKNYSDQIEASDVEIHTSKTSEWEQVDCSKINAHITSEQIKK